MEDWVAATGARIVVVFEGRDAAGKGGTIKRITQYMNPRITRIVALPKPSDRERTQWYFQRYIDELPAAGEIVLFDRSWYNRAGIEKVLGFCTPEEHQRFLRQCPIVERLLVEDGIRLVKYWFSVSDEEQERRFRARIDDPIRRWKLSETDLFSRSRWVDYSRAKDEMFVHTDIPEAPLVRRRGRRQAQSPHQQHRPPALADPVREGRPPEDPRPRAPVRRGLRAAGRARRTTRSPTTPRRCSADRARPGCLSASEGAHYPARTHVRRPRTPQRRAARRGRAPRRAAAGRRRRRLGQDLDARLPRRAAGRPGRPARADPAPHVHPPRGARDAEPRREAHRRGRSSVGSGAARSTRRRTGCCGSTAGRSGSRRTSRCSTRPTPPT